MSDRKTTERVISHPCEDFFEIENNSTIMTVAEPRSTQLAEHSSYDDKDCEIEEQYQEIYDKAMDAFDDIQQDMEGIEGKFKARNNEVGVAFLNAALSAAKEKARLKEHKDKLTGPSGDGNGGTTNNTQVNISSSDLIKMFANQLNPANNSIPDAIEVEAEPVKTKSGNRTQMKRKKNSEEV